MPPEALTIDHPTTVPRPEPKVLRSVFQANGDDVRMALADLAENLAAAGAPEDTCGSAEIVLAEILNNVVEHAYADKGQGEIQLELEIQSQRLHAKITDFGCAMPNSRMPPKKEANIDVDRQDLPEGGFGWFLIHELVESLSYMRRDNANIVRFSIRFD